jgi:hypothetical protein
MLLDEVSLSHEATRIAPPDTPAADAIERHGVDREHVEVASHRRPALQHRLSDGSAFDGVLASLATSGTSAGFRIEVDGLSGRMRLHLRIRETTYGAILATQYAKEHGIGVPFEELTGQARLLTMSMMVVNDDDQVFLVRRSESVGVARGQYAPAVNGNMELYDRRGLVADRDADGRPDPVRAMLREAREELGIGGQGLHQRPLPLGLARFSTTEEKDVHVLLYTLELSSTADDLVAGMRDADPVEGRWEVGTSMMTIDLREAARPERLESLVRWLAGSPDLVPHSAAGVLLILAARGELDLRTVPRLAPAAVAPGELPPGVTIASLSPD